MHWIFREMRNLPEHSENRENNFKQIIFDILFFSYLTKILILFIIKNV
jgi:hypothetical protein